MYAGKYMQLEAQNVRYQKPMKHCITTKFRKTKTFAISSKQDNPQFSFTTQPDQVTSATYVRSDDAY